MDSIKTVLVAHLVTCGRLDDGVRHVGWSANEAGDGPHVIVSALDEDAASSLLVSEGGDDQGQVYDAGVVRVMVSSSYTDLELSPQAAMGLGVERLVRIETPNGSPPAILDALETLVANVELTE